MQALPPVELRTSISPIQMPSPRTVTKLPCTSPNILQPNTVKTTSDAHNQATLLQILSRSPFVIPSSKHGTTFIGIMKRQSEPLHINKTTTSAGKRRTIFCHLAPLHSRPDNNWTSTLLCDAKSNTWTRYCGNALVMPTTTNDATIADFTAFWMREFAPPANSLVMLQQHEHWQPLRTIPSKQQQRMLPSLPRPLQRFNSITSEGVTHSKALHGLYPMVSTGSILRRASHKPQRAIVSTTSQNQPKTKCIAINAAASNDVRNRVSFDPRVTITEFHDNVLRQWFLDEDLERFRVETVLLAQSYLLRHPHLIYVYNTPTFDPITGTMRKKALFSLPALSHHTSMHQDETNVMNATRQKKRRTTLKQRPITEQCACPT
jgi:hypothetical protein